jgi:hypothetical protein
MPEEVGSKTVGMIVKMNETTCYIGIGINPSKQENELSPSSLIATGRSAFQAYIFYIYFLTF